MTHFLIFLLTLAILPMGWLGLPGSSPLWVRRGIIGTFICGMCAAWAAAALVTVLVSVSSGRVL